MDKKITLAGKHLCTGCGACKAVCPKNAISFSPDAEGFPSPVVSEAACVQCGLCEKTCPVMLSPAMHRIQDAYAAQIRDQDALQESTSGGVFTALSREIFRCGGVVYGCVWDEEYNAFIRRAVNEEEIKPMRGSKYVWSWAGDAFPDVKADLEAGRTVLFTGLPCQVAGLKNYLKRDYGNLFLADCLCSGAPSPLALDKYLDTLCKREDRGHLNLKFRDKEPYGVGIHITYNGKRKKTKAEGEHITNPYYYSFFTRLIDRESCFTCSYNTAARVSDITFADFWGVKSFHPEMAIRQGVSALMVNTDHGADLLNRIRDTLELQATKIENIAKANNLSTTDIPRKRKRPTAREEFFKTLREKGWPAAERKYLLSRARLRSWLKVRLPKKIVKLLK